MFLRLSGPILIALTLAGCASSVHRAPVESRTPSSSVGGTVTPVVADTPGRALPGAENAGKPGYYTIKPGDTLIRVSLEVGQSWRDIAKWNGIENPNVIETGQVLRVVPPGQDAAAPVVRAIPPAAAVKPAETKPADAKPAEAKPVEARASDAKGVADAKPAAEAGKPAASAAAGGATTPGRTDEDELPWAWPAGGAIVENFEEGKNKGIGVGGKAGDPVYAAADGRVVYAGSGLHGYGNLIIVKHNATYLTAYAHNQALLVKMDQNVKRGQKIAEMGSTDSDRVQLHFEIRRLGRPVDPTRLLPPR